MVRGTDSHDSKELFQSVLYSMGDAVIATDRSARITHMNGKAEALTGWSEAEACGRTLTEVFRIINENTREAIESPADRVLRDGVVVGLANHTLLLSKDGTERPIADSGAPIRGKDGVITGVVLVFRDQTEERANKKLLEQRLALSGTVAELSLRLLGVDESDEDNAIHEALARIGALTDSDRCYVFLFDEQRETMNNTHEVCAEGIRPERENLQNLSCGIFPWWMSKLEALERIHVPRVAEIPVEGSAEKAILEAQEIQSVLIVPLAWDRRLVGFVGFDAVRREREWTEEEFVTLETLANLLSLSFQQRATTRALDLERRQLLSLFDSIDEPIYVSDMDTYEILFANRHLQKLFGSSLIGKTCYEVLQGRAEPCDFCTNPILLSRGSEPYHWKHYNPKLDKHFHIIDRCIQWSDGRSVRFELAIDMTASERAQEALEASEKLYRLITEHMADVITVSDLSLRTTYVSPSVERLRGFSVEEAMEQPLEEFLVPESSSRAMKLFQEEMALEVEGTADPSRIRVLEFEERRKDGSTVWVEVNFSFLRDQEMQPIGVLSLTRDITERKHADEELRASEERFRTIFDCASDGILLADPNTKKFVMANRAMCEMLGYSEEELLHCGLEDLQPNQEGKGELNSWTHVVGLQDRAVVNDLRLRRKDGGNFHVEGSFVGISLEGRFLIVGSFRDVTEKRAMHASLAQADRLASMGMLAAGVAHEINNPLSYVLFNVDSLVQDLNRFTSTMARCSATILENLGEETYREVIAGGEDLISPAGLGDMMDRAREALGGLHQIREISKGLGTFSRVEHTALAQVDVKDAMECAVNMAFNEIKYRARLVKDYSPAPTVAASEGKLAQVFLNLLINAAHAIVEGDVDNHRITVRIWSETRDVVVEVADTGMGIALEDQAQIFEPFFSTKERGIGSGLGLAICRNIVNGFGGDVSVVSKVGEGSSFRVRLPIGRHEQKDIPSTPRKNSSIPPLRGRILVVDDEAAIRRVLRRLLGRDHDVVLVDSGEEACRLLEQDQAFDLILCDLMMPKTSGAELHAWLIERNPALAHQIVFVTGGAFTPHVSDYLMTVDNLRVEKPFDGPNLRKLVAELIKASRLEGVASERR